MKKIFYNFAIDRVSSQDRLYFQKIIKYSKNINMLEKKYITPEIEVLEVYSEGVICGSNEILDENEGEW